jgi:hypothetical protein
MDKPYLRLIGDVHGQSGEYLYLTDGAEYTIQLGDLSFDYGFLKNVDPQRHKIVAGNHDNYAKLCTENFVYMQTGHWLGDYGVYTVPDFGDIFFVRGGRSIDAKYRKAGRNWFPDEEMNYKTMNMALEKYIDVKPDFVVSHECPGQIIDLAFGPKTWDGELLRPSMTAKLLDMMWNNHQPSLWIFGHHHKTFDQQVHGTRFVCLPELGYLDFGKNS